MKISAQLTQLAEQGAENEAGKFKDKIENSSEEMIELQYVEQAVVVAKKLKDQFEDGFQKQLAQKQFEEQDIGLLELRISQLRAAMAAFERRKCGQQNVGASETSGNLKTKNVDPNDTLKVQLIDG